MSCEEWPLDRTCLPLPPNEDDPAYDEAVTAAQASAESIAVQVLWALSGRQFGICDVIARPCPSAPQLPWYGSHPYDQSIPPYTPLFVDGTWYNFSCACGFRCRMGGPNVVHLPGPAGEIVTVTIGSTVLAPNVYVMEGDLLYRRDGVWPSQDYSRPLGDPGTWSVEYWRGIPVPPGVDRLTAMLAREMITACQGGKCRLPRTVVSTSRSGVSHVFDPSKMLSSGFTGLSEVDTWLAAINPNHLMAAPNVI